MLKQYGSPLTLTGTRIHTTDSDGVRLTVQTQADGVVSGVAQSLSLLGPISTCHWALGIQHYITNNLVNKRTFRTTQRPVHEHHDCFCDHYPWFTVGSNSEYHMTCFTAHETCQEYSSEKVLWCLKDWTSHQNTSCWATVLTFQFKYVPAKIGQTSCSFLLFAFFDSRSACVPVTTAQLSTGWDRRAGCRVCVSRAGRCCSVCCGWRVWCYRLTAGHSWPSGFASPSFHMACCSSATPLSPSWRNTEGERETGVLRAFKMSNCWSKQWQRRKSKGRLCVEKAVGFVRFDKFCFYSWCHKYNAYTGGGQGFWLQSLVSPLGFMLDLLQKLLWTILLSTFLLQPYRRYCFPTARGDGEFNKCRSRETGMQ